MLTAIELILALLRADAAPQTSLQTAQAAAVDWDDLAVTALALGLAPLLHYRLEAAGLTLPEARAQAKLAFARQTEAARHAARSAQLAEVLGQMSAVPIVLKGAYLAEHVYPQPGLRPMNDVDLLFQPQDLPEVTEALGRLGYGEKVIPPEQGPGITKHTSTFKRPGDMATPNPYLSSGAGHMIEPHRSLEEAWFGLRCDLTPGVWARSVPMEAAGRPARTLSAEDNLLHLAVHLAFHLIMGSPSFVQLADIAVYVERVRLDWAVFTKRAEERRAAGFAYAALRLGQTLLGAPVPADVLVQLARQSPVRVLRAANGLSLADMMRRTQQAPLRTVGQRLRRGVRDRAETARWAQSPGEWLRIWGSLFSFWRTDTWRLVTQRRS